MTEQPCLTPSKDRSGWYSLGGYILLSMAAYWPLCLHLLDYPSQGLPDYDIGQFFWHIWWTCRQWTSLESVYQCPIIFYPEGTNLAFESLQLFNTLFVFPFQQMGLPQLGYNLVFLASGAFSGWGVYLLCRDLKISPRAAWLAGALFLLAPYRYGQIDHFNLINTIPIPFYLLWMRRGILQKGWKGAILWGLWLFITANTAWYYLFFLLCLSPFWLGYLLAGLKDRSAQIQGLYRTLIASGVFILLFLPQFMAILNGYQPTEQSRPIEVLVYWSADLLQLITPPFLLHEMPESGEFAVFPGIILCILVLFVLYPFKNLKGGFWLAVSAAGALLALGPVLKVGGHLTGFWLPGYWLNKIPLLKAMRTVVRWSLIYQLGFILFFASNYSRLDNWWRKRTQLTPWIPIVLILGAVFFENFPGLFPHSNARPPAIIKELARIDPEASVLHLPEAGPKETGRYMFLQTQHGLPICNGYTPFKSSLQHLAKYPSMAILTHQSGTIPDRENIHNDFKELNLGWIILHPEYFQNKHEIGWLDTLLIQKYQAQCLHRDEEIWVYHLQQEYDTVPAHPQAQVDSTSQRQ